MSKPENKPKTSCERFRAEVMSTLNLITSGLKNKVDIITIQEDGHCKMCGRELVKGMEVTLDDGFIFCFKDEEGEDSTCHQEYIEAES